MTQDQYGQARGSGHVVHGDVVPEDETEEAGTEESKPMTRFQKVASALRGGGSEQDEAAEDEAAADPAAEDRAAEDRAAEDRASMDRPAADVQAADAQAGGLPWVTPQDEAAMTGSPISRETAQKHDYWDDPDATAGHEDNAVAVTSPDTPPDRQATDPDMFGATRRTGEAPATAPATEGQPGAATIADVPAARPAPGAEAAGSTGRHAAATPASGELRPGEATGALG
ncbi:MAG TPA: hypothetical protein VGF32_22400, partial [Streptosporangiaceae bacterium]